MDYLFNQIMLLVRNDNKLYTMLWDIIRNVIHDEPEWSRITICEIAGDYFVEWWRSQFPVTVEEATPGDVHYWPKELIDILFDSINWKDFVSEFAGDNGEWEMARDQALRTKTGEVEA